MTPLMPRRLITTALASAGLTAAVFTVVLFVQHARRAPAVTAASPPAAVVRGPTPEARSQPSVPSPRVPVDVAAVTVQALDIQVEEGVPLADYPRIKCNIARRTGERIYHLPFDQQYDSTVIEPARGECFIATTAEAEALGFRRAWRWHGAAQDG